MKASALKYAILSTLVTLTMVILVVIPFHALLSVWLASLVGHYTALRLWKEVLLLICLGGVAYMFMADSKTRTHTLSRRMIQLIIIYGSIQLLWGLVAYEKHDVSAKALGYGLIINLRLVAFFLVTWATAVRTNRLHNQWQRLLLWPAMLVVGFGLLQVFILPRNFLSHLGYGPQTIAPYETINHNSHYIRIMSTLRGANPLGAYLLIPISAVGSLIVRGKRGWPYLIFLGAILLTLFFTFSRAAWIGAVLAGAVIIVVAIRSDRTRRRLTYTAIFAAVILIGLGIGFRNNTHIQNILFHTQSNSTVKATSDAGHSSALRSGIHDVLHDPLGRGPGSAGPASVYNNHPARIAENYYIQIGQETGWLGLAVFLLINAGVGYLLWLRRRDPLALCLLASLVGLSFVNLLSHAWADDTLSYVWWGLAGIAMASLPKSQATILETTADD